MEELCGYHQHPHHPIVAFGPSPMLVTASRLGLLAATRACGPLGLVLVRFVISESEPGDAVRVYAGEEALCLLMLLASVPVQWCLAGQLCAYRAVFGVADAASGSRSLLCHQNHAKLSWTKACLNYVASLLHSPSLS
jgi:hypothetical protein